MNTVKFWPFRTTYCYILSDNQIAPLQPILITWDNASYSGACIDTDKNQENMRIQFEILDIFDDNTKCMPTKLFVCFEAYFEIIIIFVFGGRGGGEVKYLFGIMFQANVMMM